jgi:dTDP-4-dehydrorhamnose 3,5-epimerase-like enzyme
MTFPEPKENLLAIGERNGRHLSLVKKAIKDIAIVIQKLEGPDLTAGVEIETGLVHPDERGFFTKLFRLGDSPLTKGLAGHITRQASPAVSLPDILKARHSHFDQTDNWAPVCAVFQVVLCDLREGSRTRGLANTICVGALCPWRLAARSRAWL